MFLIDTSAWIRHLKGLDTPLSNMLEANEVLIHPFVVGELACGALKARKQVLELLEALPSVLTVDHKEVLTMLDAHKIYASGIGWVDAHLLASCLINRCQLLTYDKALSKISKKLGVSE